MRAKRRGALQGKFKKETGASLLGVLVGMLLLGIIMVSFLMGTDSISKARKVVEARGRTSAVESALVNELGLIVKSLNPNICLDQSEVANRPFGYGNSTASLKHSTAITNNAAKGLAAVNEAIKRCKNPVFISASEVGDASKSHLYFCLILNQNGSNSTPLFVEFSIDFASIATNAQISCAEFLQDRSAVARATYGIYFTDQYNSAKYGTTIYKSMGP